MLNVTLKGIWSHKRRLIGTVVAVVLGVAFLAGTLVLGDTMRAGFSSLFTDINSTTDAEVRSATEIGTDQTQERGLLDESLTDTIRDVDGVAAAAPQVVRLGQVVGADGETLGGTGPPTVAASWIDEPRLNPWTIARGRAPRADNEVVLARDTADDGKLRVGDTTTVLTPSPVSVEVVGIATIRGEGGLGGATWVAFTLDGAMEHLLREPGKVTNILVAADGGVSQEQLVENLEPVLPPGVEAITGTALTEENNQDIEEDFLGFFETFLLVFAGIALLVGTFSIYNTFSIITAQRSRESALLRALGASRGQVLVSIGAEALLIGILASAIGLAVGVALAAGLLALMEAGGLGLPEAGLQIHASTVIWAFAVGTLVTLLASLPAAFRTSRVPPLAALRELALDRSAASRTRLVTGLVLTLGGVIVVITAAVDPSGNRLGLAGVGALAAIVGIVVLGPVLARPTAAVLGKPLLRFKPAVGRLAQQNAVRNPRRTASTAAALMIGIAVVALFTVFAASLKAAIDSDIEASFRGDLVIATRDFSASGLSPELAQEIDTLPEVATATGWGIGSAQIDGRDVDLTVIDPRPFDSVFDLGVTDGSIRDLSDNQIAVSDSEAEKRGWSVGDEVPVFFVADGAEERFEIGAIYDRTTSAGNYVIPSSAWVQHTAQPFDIVVMIALRDGVSVTQGRAAVEAVAEQYFAPEVQTREEYLDGIAGEIDVFLTIIYGMLALAIIIAVMGIANTLSLSIHERTRELGLLRAVGLSQSQLRSMVRWESVIIAVFGTLLGAALGLFLGWAFVEAVSNAEDIAAPFTVPVGQIILVLVFGSIVGLLAGFRPARRAARLDILEAIATE
jgi:putative ABC transport system permease protein